MNVCLRLCGGRSVAGSLILIFLLAAGFDTEAQPVIVSTVPANGATGVSPTASVLITFSQAMNPGLTMAQFIVLPSTLLSTTPTWNSGNTILTNTPTTPFPSNTLITWIVSGQSAGGTNLGGIPTGSFTTGSGGGGGGGGGSGTNAITTFSLGKIFFYDQTSAAAPTPDPNASYGFNAATTLASNRTASSVTLTLPNSAISNLTQNPVAPENFFLVYANTNLTVFSNTWPDGNYTFTVFSNASSQMVTVTLPPTMVQPNAPHVTNYSAAQAVNPAQSFTLGWDAFQNGTSTDYVHVAIGTAFMSPNPGTAGSLTGTTTSFVIPGNTLAPNSNYTSSLTFYRQISTTNVSGYATIVYKATSTQFSFITSSGAASGPLVLTNAVLAPGSFSFDVLSATGQTFTVQWATDILGLWQILLTTNSSTGRVHVNDLRSTSSHSLFYRARNGT